jgi:hypothetical protein
MTSNNFICEDRMREIVKLDNADQTIANEG